MHRLLVSLSLLLALGVAGAASAASLVGTFPGNDFYSEGNGRCTVCDIVGDPDLMLLEREPEKDGGSLFEVSFDSESSGTWNNQGSPIDPQYFVVKAGPNFALFRVTDPSGDSWDTLDIPNRGCQIPGLSHMSFYGKVPEPSTGLLLGLALPMALGRRARRRTGDR